MDKRDPDIIGRQTSLIALLAVIILVLIIVVFFFGYCEPRHVQLNATPASMPATGGSGPGNNNATATNGSGGGNGAGDTTRVQAGGTAANNAGNGNPKGSSTDADTTKGKPGAKPAAQNSKSNTR